jgi:hypothetical protein
VPLRRDDGAAASTAGASTEDPPFANTANSGAPDPVELPALGHSIGLVLRSAPRTKADGAFAIQIPRLKPRVVGDSFRSAKGALLPRLPFVPQGKKPGAPTEKQRRGCRRLAPRTVRTKATVRDSATTHRSQTARTMRHPILSSCRLWVIISSESYGQRRARKQSPGTWQV